MQRFTEKILICLQKHTEKGVGGGQIDCHVWNGKKDSYGYGIKKVTWPNGRKSYEKVHRLAYMAHLNNYQLPSTDNFGEQLDVSHRCHEKLCINAEHLTLESHSVNMSRNYCRKTGVCTMAHVPSCVF